jgi:hypothetical protein
MTTTSEGATIVLTRARGGWRDRARSYAVMIDAHEVAKVRRGQRLELPVAPGRHEVYLFIAWCRSPTVTVHAQPGEVIQLFCEPAGSAREGLQAVTRNADVYIKLVRSEAGPEPGA